MYFDLWWIYYFFSKVSRKGEAPTGSVRGHLAHEVRTKEYMDTHHLQGAIENMVRYCTEHTRRLLGCVNNIIASSMAYRAQLDDICLFVHPTF